MNAALAFVFVSCLAPAAAAADDDTLVVDRITAVVNTSVVLQSELDALLEQMNELDPIPPGMDVKKVTAARRKELLETLIAEKLLEEEVRKLRVDVTNAEVDRMIQATMQENNLNEQQLQMALARQGLTLEEYKDGLKKQLTKMKIIQLKVKNRVQITDQDVKSRLAQKKVLDAGEFRVKARHILWLVPPGETGDVQKGRADTAKAKLDAAASDKEKLSALFSELAQAESDDPSSKVRGGDLGEFGRGEMVPEFERAAYQSPPGVVAGPVRTAFGWHLILVDERVALSAQEGEQQALENLRQRLYESEVEQQFRAYVEELKRAAYIERR